MNSYSDFDLSYVSWNDVREEVHTVNPTLAAICDQINPNNEYKLLKIKYQYGAKIVDNGDFHLPTTHNTSVMINDSVVPEDLKSALSYSQIPLSLVLTKSAEVFVETEERVIPLNFFNPGDLFGMFEVANIIAGIESPKAIWSVSSGARSIFMLPKITDAAFHKKLKKRFNIKTSAPNTLASQWKTFVSLHNTLPANQKWYSTILVFTKKWFEGKNPTWTLFYSYLLKLTWSQLQLLPKTFGSLDLLNILFSREITKRNLKPRIYILDTVKQLISIAQGYGIAFKPTLDDSALPNEFLQDAYVDHYSLKDYTPTIMQPSKIMQSRQVYYSLSFPTISGSSSFTRSTTSIIEDLREIKRLVDILAKISVPNHVSFAQNINFEFFHVDKDQYKEIELSQHIPDKDTRFTDTRFTDRVFCSSSRFFVGCIRISMKTANDY